MGVGVFAGGLGLLLGGGGELGELRGGERGGEGGGLGDVDEQDVLAGEVERDVLVRLEEAQLADALGADAAGGEVGDAAVVELDADVGDIDAAAEDGEADGADLADGRLRRCERTMSRSWIMRSRTTSTSSERGVKTLRR